MQRYNVFYQIHKGLRAMLYNTAANLQQTDFINEEEASTVLKQVEETLDLFDEHANTEDGFVLPAIEKFDSSVSTIFEKEHVEDHELSNRMRTLLTMFYHSRSTIEQTELGSAIRYAFVEFMVFNLQHMAKEEIVLNKLLWQYFTDVQLQGITQEILAHVPPASMERYSTWMMRGLSNKEIIHWLKEVKNNAPEFVFSNLLSIAENELAPARWNMVQEGITEGAMLA